MKSVRHTQWSTVSDSDGSYQVSSCGMVYSFYYSKILSPYSDKDGYLGYRLKIKEKIKNIKEHRLVFKEFNGYEPEEVNHINGIKYDNRISNLEGSDRKLNAAHAVSSGLYCSGVDNPNTRLNESDILEIVNLLKDDKISIRGLGRMFDCSATAIGNINMGKTYLRETGSLVNSYPIRKK